MTLSFFLALKPWNTNFIALKLLTLNCGNLNVDSLLKKEDERERHKVYVR
jgi:hypothetical protein